MYHKTRLQWRRRCWASTGSRTAPRMPGKVSLLGGQGGVTGARAKNHHRHKAMWLSDNLPALVLRMYQMEHDVAEAWQGLCKGQWISPGAIYANLALPQLGMPLAVPAPEGVQPVQGPGELKEQGRGEWTAPWAGRPESAGGAWPLGFAPAILLVQICQ